MQTLAMLLLLLRWTKTWNSILPQHKQKFFNVVTVPRDEHLASLQDNTLLFIYGWYMHASGSGQLCFPTSANAALPVSLHISSDQILQNPAVLAFLSRVGPVGCRDFSTLDKLRARSLPSFYSGCVTMTLPKAHKRRTGFLAVETAAAPASATKLSMWEATNSSLSPWQLWTRALCVFRLLRRTAVVFTSRLHTFLPSLAMGTTALVRAPGRRKQSEVEDWGSPGRWKTANMYVKKERDFEWDARRLEGQIACTLGRIINGHSVVEAWRKSVFIHMAFCFDVGFVEPTLVAIGSLLYHNGELPLFLHLKHLNVPATELSKMQDKILARFPGTSLRFSVCRSTHNRYNQFLPHVTEATMGRLWLHEDLQDVDRIIYIDGDCLVRGSIAGLVDLSVQNIAARTAHVNTMKFPQWNNGHPWPHSKSINAGVLVMNLRTLRKNNFSAFVENVLQTGPLNDQSILNLYLQGAHQELSREYNFFWKESGDIFSSVDPLIVHYAGSVKPWLAKPTLARGADVRRKNLTAEWHAYKADCRF